MMLARVAQHFELPVYHWRRAQRLRGGWWLVLVQVHVVSAQARTKPQVRGERAKENLEAAR